MGNDSTDSSLRVPTSDEVVEWSSVRDGAVAAFNGEKPNDGTESAIIDVFKLYPQEVIHEINVVAEAVNNGQARSGWAVLRHRVAKIEAISQRRNASVSLGPNRDKAHARADQYMRAAGLYLPSEEEVIEELFGERGQLEAFPELQQDMLDLWEELRPKAERAEREAIERGLHYRAKQALAGSAAATIPPEARNAVPFANLPFPGSPDV